MKCCIHAGRQIGGLALAVLLVFLANPAAAQKPNPNKKIKGQPMKELLSSGGTAALVGLEADGIGSVKGIKGKANGRGANSLVNDACLDKAPGDLVADPNGAPSGIDAFANDRVVQSETEIAVLNVPGSMGKKMVAGYNDSWGFYDNTKGLSGFSFSTDGGKTWIDGGGLPPLVPGATPFDAGHDGYFGDPVLAVHHASETFYYASIYGAADGRSTISVNRGHFANEPAQGSESVANTLCLANPARTGVPTPPPGGIERIIWDAPVEAIPTGTADYTTTDFADKEWLYVDQGTGALYLTYTNFRANNETPLQLTRSTDGGQTWDGPFTVVPNLDDTFNQATQPIVTPDGKVVVTYLARTFDIVNPPFPEISQRIEVVVSNDNGATFGSRITVANVNPMGEPPGYNRGRASILNAPYIAVDKGQDDGVGKPGDAGRAGFGNIYIAYFDGATPVTTPPFARTSNIHLSRSTDGGATWGPGITVNDDGTATAHVFPSVQVNKNGQVFVAWIDRRLDVANNLAGDTWAARSTDQGASFGSNALQSDESTGWFVRADARPNMGDYNSSELLGFNQFVTIWADGRFRPGSSTSSPVGPNTTGTPDVYFFKVKGLN